MRMMMIMGLSLLMLFGCDDDGGTDAGSVDAGGVDAGPGSDDAGPGDEDAGPGGDDAGPGGDDAGSGGDDAGPSCPDLMVQDDGSETGTSDLVISEIAPGMHIELFNAGDSAVDLSDSDYMLCSRPAYVALASLSSETVPPGGYITLEWPTGGPRPFSDTDPGGELVLYADTRYMRERSVIDFVCWGTGHTMTMSRRSVAEGAGKWSGDCAPALSAGALHRRVMTGGAALADYDVTSAPSPLTCMP